MNKKLLKDLRTHLSEITPPDQLEGIYSMCLSIVELSVEKGLKDLNVGLPTFLSWGGETSAPVEEIVKEWKLRPFIDRAREDNHPE